jgi:hypothetical protein
VNERQCEGFPRSWADVFPPSRQHLEAIKPKVASGLLVLGGASLDEPLKEGASPKINGSVMMVEADSEAEVWEVIKGDIYYEKGVWDAEKVSFDFSFSGWELWFVLGSFSLGGSLTRLVLIFLSLRRSRYSPSRARCGRGLSHEWTEG